MFGSLTGLNQSKSTQIAPYTLWIFDGIDWELSSNEPEPYLLSNPTATRYSEIRDRKYCTITNVHSYRGSILGGVPNPWRFGPVSLDKRELLSESDCRFFIAYIHDSASFTISFVDGSRFLYVDGDTLVPSETPKATWFLERESDPSGGFLYT